MENLKLEWRNIGRGLKRRMERCERKRGGGYHKGRIKGEVRDREQGMIKDRGEASTFVHGTGLRLASCCVWLCKKPDLPFSSSLLLLLK